PRRKWKINSMPFALSPLPKSPSGQHFHSDGGVSPSENVSPECFFLFSLRVPKKPLRATLS
ncbi:MAG TPA: hypothetical protein PKN54_11175, partial [Candidatus Cloacimonas acidaminovorans]|nr:hypothetical protein [Candidatus Cloacimonas acidaminovorans]